VSISKDTPSQSLFIVVVLGCDESVRVLVLATAPTLENTSPALMMSFNTSNSAWNIIEQTL
jgi:hypothetical protein